MAKTYSATTADGSTNQFNVPFQYIDKSHVYVTVDGTIVTYSWVNASRVQTIATPSSGAKVVVKRVTPTDSIVTHQAASILKGADLNLTATQELYISEELEDKQDRTLSSPDYEPSKDMTLPSNRAGKILGFNESGSPISSTKTMEDFETYISDASQLSESATLALQYKNDAAASAASSGADLFARPVDEIAPDEGSEALGRRVLLGKDNGVHPNQVAEYFSNGWHYSGPPSVGQMLRVISPPGNLFFDGALWRDARNEIDVFFYGPTQSNGGSGDNNLAIMPPPGVGWQYDGTNGLTPLGTHPEINRGGPHLSFAATWYAQTGRRVCIVQTAVAGSAISATSDVGNGNWGATGTLRSNAFTRTSAAIEALKARGDIPIFRGAIGIQGERESNGINLGEAGVTKAYYKAALVDWITAYRTEYGDTMPFWLIRIGTSPEEDDAGYAQIRAAQKEVADADPYTKIVFWDAVNFPGEGLQRAPGDPIGSVHWNQYGCNKAGVVAATSVLAGIESKPDSDPTPREAIGDIAGIIDVARGLTLHTPITGQLQYGVSGTGDGDVHVQHVGSVKSYASNSKGLGDFDPDTDWTHHQRGDGGFEIKGSFAIPAEEGKGYLAIDALSQIIFALSRKGNDACLQAFEKVGLAPGYHASVGTDDYEVWAAKGAGLVRKSHLVSELPVASGDIEGATSFVTDATANTFGTTAVGGGTNKVPVWCDGTTWKIG